MKTLDDAVIELNGVLPSCLKSGFNTENGWYISTKGKLAHSESCVWFDLRQFQQRAKELGFVGRYRWGIEYATDGKQPELADDVVVNVALYPGDDCSGHPAKVAVWKGWVDGNILRFKITDQRYKPDDTSYLDKSDSSTGNGAEWYDYDNQKALRLPPVGVECEANIAETIFYRVIPMYFGNSNVVVLKNPITGNDFYVDQKEVKFRPLDHDRKAKAERKRVVDAAYSEFNDMCHPEDALYGLYDKGFLRLPD